MPSKTILITGCSSGIGHDTALALMQRGHLVVASCRSEADLIKLKAEGLKAVLLDVRDSNSIEKGLQDALEITGGRIDVLLNNAGYGQVGALEDVPREVLREQFETNVFGLMDLTRRVIPIMRKQGQGRIINISSVLGFIALPFYGAYTASKYAVEGLSDTLRLELKSSGIRVITIEPGPIESRFRANVLSNSVANIDQEKSYFKEQYQRRLKGYENQKKPAPFSKGTDAVIAKLILAIESPRPKIKYRITLPTHFFATLKRMLSVGMLDRLLAYASRRDS